MNAQEFWLRYCRAQGQPNDMQEQAIDMFLEAMQEVLWAAGRQSGRSTVRRGFIAFLQEAEKIEDRRHLVQFEEERQQGAPYLYLYDEIADWPDRKTKIFFTPDPPPLS
jgi:hypothetical protein